jgi:CheY-like chemotaxis protein
MTAQSRILVVDDEPDIRRLLSMALGCEHDIAFAAECHREQASDSLPDVMLLDLRMPRMDGATLLMTMQSDARLRSLPVIALSAAPARTTVVGLAWRPTWISRSTWICC